MNIHSVLLRNLLWQVVQLVLFQSDLHQLNSFVTASYSFRGTRSLTISSKSTKLMLLSDLPNITYITFSDGYYTSNTYYSPFNNLVYMNLTSNCNDWISIDLPKFVTLTVGKYVLRETSNFVISSNTEDFSFIWFAYDDHSHHQTRRSLQLKSPINQYYFQLLSQLDLPLFKNLNTQTNNFRSGSSLTLNSIPHSIFLKDLPSFTSFSTASYVFESGQTINFAGSFFTHFSVDLPSLVSISLSSYSFTSLISLTLSSFTYYRWPSDFPNLTSIYTSDESLYYTRSLTLTSNEHQEISIRFA